MKIGQQLGPWTCIDAYHDGDDGGDTCVMSVGDGLLIRAREWVGDGVRVSLAFVPDWDLDYLLRVQLAIGEPTKRGDQ